MRKVLGSAALVAALVVGFGGQAWAAPPDGPAVQISKGRTLTWTSPKLVPMGDAAVEFYDGDRLLGRPTTKDHRTFTLEVEHPGQIKDLEVRAGGRRLDAPPAKRIAAPPKPATIAPLPPAPVDPGVTGPYSTLSGEYDLAGLPIPNYPAPVEMRAVVVAPKGAPGRRPLALFLHGRHYTCFEGADPEKITGDWPCPAPSQPIPSHRGYLQAQELLASQGYVTVSISANGINGQDYLDEDGGAQARSSLIRAHLAQWADWAAAGRATAPAVVRQAPIADLSRTFLMGHSRGGEGVNRAAMDSLNPPPAAQDGYHGKVRWNIRGLLLIGPTIFGQNPAPDVPSATILPGCDGDVSDLQGQMFIDATRGVSKGRALHSSLYVVGANHNYFNTEWTPGQAVAPSFDDFPEEHADPICSPGTPTRLTARQEQNVGATYIAAAARLFVGGDDRVRPLLDGTGVRAPSADPARVVSHAIGAARTAAVIPDKSVRVTGAGRLCEQVEDDPAQACLTIGEDSWYSPSPHFTSFAGLPDEPGRYAVALNWSRPGKTVSIRPDRAARISGDKLALRIVVPPNTAGTRFGVAATDSRGRRVNLGEVTVDGLPGSEFANPYWAREVRVPLKGLTSIAKLDLTPRTSSGSALLIDAWGWRPGTPAPRPAALPRVDIGGLAVEEGDSGSRTYRVPVKITGRGDAQVRVFLIDGLTYQVKSWVARIRPGTRTIPVPITVVGNTLYSEGKQYLVGMKAIRGAFIGDYVGIVDVADDDPAPTVTVSPVADTVAEGGALTWRITLSEPAETSIFVYGEVQAPGTARELSSTDVDPDWFTERSGEDPEPSRPLSETYLFPYTDVPAGELTGDLTIPTIADNLAEPAEQLRLQLYSSVAEESLGTVTGTVTD
jgi:hypothetical protein